MSNADMSHTLNVIPDLHQPAAEHHSDSACAAAQQQCSISSQPCSAASPAGPKVPEHTDARSPDLTQEPDSDDTSDPYEYPPSFESRSASPESHTYLTPAYAGASSIDTIANESLSLPNPDPAVWSKLPVEILAIIIEHCDRQTIINWSCTHGFFYDIASNALWKSLFLPPEAMSVFTQCKLRDRQGKCLFRGRRTGRVWEPCKNNMVHFLDKKAFGENSSVTEVAFPVPSARLPGERVRNLRVNFVASYPHNHFMMTSPRHIDAVVLRLLTCMPNLQSFSFEGILHQQTLAVLAIIRSLRKLELRGEEDSLQALDPDFDSAGQPIPAMGLVLDFRNLGIFNVLRDLTVGRLTPLEAHRLGEAIIKLDLDHLCVSSAPPVDGAHAQADFRGTIADESPLLTLLKSILQHGRQDISGETAGTFPLTLRTLTLRDHYRIWQHCNENVLLDTVSPCRNLTYIEIQVKAVRPLENFLMHATFPSLNGFSMGACQHTLDWTDWTILGLENRSVALSQPPSEIACALKKFLRKHCQTLACLTLMQIHMDPQIRDLALCFNKKQISELWGSRCIHNLEPNRQAQMNWDIGLWSEYCYERDFCYAEDDEVAL
ncbi:MAG: hypothetical protein Q9210_005391 [Variospora velana]